MGGPFRGCMTNTGSKRQRVSLQPRNDWDKNDICSGAQDVLTLFFSMTLNVLPGMGFERLSLQESEISSPTSYKSGQRPHISFPSQPQASRSHCSLEGFSWLCSAVTPGSAGGLYIVPESSLIDPMKSKCFNPCTITLVPTPLGMVDNDVPARFLFL